MDSGPARLISSRPSSEEEDRLQRFQVLLQQSGGDPSSILELLSTVVRRRDWQRLPDKLGGSKGFIAYFRDLGWSRDDLERFVMNAFHRFERPPRMRPEVRDEMVELRKSVRDILNPEPEKHGGDRRSENALKLVTEQSSHDQVDIVNLMDDRPKGGNDPSYAIRRLKRDAPELAERVLSGQMSPHAAAVEAGFRKPMISIPLDPARAARLIAKHFDQDQVKALVIELCRAANIPIEATP